MLVFRGRQPSGVIVACLAIMPGCVSMERASVNFSYVVEPTRGLPEGMTALSIEPANLGPTTDAIWSDLSTTIVLSLVNESRNSFGTDVTISDRRDTQVTFDEADLAAAGRSTAPPGTGGKLLAVQGKILSNIIVQTEFNLVDSANNQIWEHYLPKTYRATNRTKASPIFGSSQTEAALKPSDAIIATLVERAAREFISRLMTCRIDVDLTVVSSRNQQCSDGVKQLRAEAFDDALSRFKAAMFDNPDDHRAAFGAGVASEASGRYDEALEYFRRACAGKNSVVYRQARDGMKAYGSRIKG